MLPGGDDDGSFEGPTKRTIDENEDSEENMRPMETPDRSKKRRTAPAPSLLEGQSRTLYFGGVTAEITVSDILNQVRGAAVEALRFFTERSCAFVDFYDAAGALTFWTRLPPGKRLNIRGADIRVGWAKPSALAPNVATALKNGASRNVYFGGLDISQESNAEELSQISEVLKVECLRFGMIDQVKLVPERQCAFVHFASVTDAMRAVSVLGGETHWLGKRVSFGRDRCIGREDRVKDKSKEKEESHTEDDREEGQLETNRPPPTTTCSKPNFPVRTVYLGGVPVETTAEDLCNVIRGGILEKIRITPEKRCAFVTFVEASAAVAFYEFASTVGLWIKGSRLKPGYGQPSAIPNAVVAALRQGATRNVYIGNIDLARVTEADLLRYFSAYGPVEMVNFLRRERNVAFVGYCALLDAVKAVEGVRKDSLFAHCNISYGKDRCAQPLRPILERAEPSTPISSSSAHHLMVPVHCMYGGPVPYDYGIYSVPAASHVMNVDPHFYPSHRSLAHATGGGLPRHFYSSPSYPLQQSTYSFPLFPPRSPHEANSSFFPPYTPYHPLPSTTTPSLHLSHPNTFPSSPSHSRPHY